MVANLVSFFAETSPITYFSITEQMVTPLANAINNSLEIMVPIGLGFMACFVGISAIKRVVYTFI